MEKSKRDPNKLYCDDESKTQQQFRDECDINRIVLRASQGADISHVNSRVARYGDFTNIPDYRAAFDVVHRAESLFMSMDWRVRERFNNDPQRMVQFLMDPKNRDEAVKLGLVNPPPDKVSESDKGGLKSNERGLGSDSGKASPAESDAKGGNPGGVR